MTESDMSFRLTVVEELKKINERLDKIEGLIDAAAEMAQTVAPLINGLKDNPLLGGMLGMVGLPDFSQPIDVEVKRIG